MSRCTTTRRTTARTTTGTRSSQVDRQPFYLSTASARPRRKGCKGAGDSSYVLSEMQEPAFPPGREADLQEVRHRDGHEEQQVTDHHPQERRQGDGRDGRGLRDPPDRGRRMSVVLAREGVLGPETDQGCRRARDQDLQVREVRTFVARILLTGCTRMHSKFF